MNAYDWTYWLQVMNFAMAAVVVLAGCTVLGAVVSELRQRRAGAGRSLQAELSALLSSEAHRIRIPELGLTMADGGEELKASDDNPDDKTK